MNSWRALGGSVRNLVWPKKTVNEASPLRRYLFVDILRGANIMYYCLLHAHQLNIDFAKYMQGPDGPSYLWKYFLFWAYSPARGAIQMISGITSGMLEVTKNFKLYKSCNGFFEYQRKFFGATIRRLPSLIGSFLVFDLLARLPVIFEAIGGIVGKGDFNIFKAPWYTWSESNCGPIHYATFAMPLIPLLIAFLFNLSVCILSAFGLGFKCVKKNVINVLYVFLLLTHFFVITEPLAIESVEKRYKPLAELIMSHQGESWLNFWKAEWINTLVPLKNNWDHWQDLMTFIPFNMYGVAFATILVMMLQYAEVNNTSDADKKEMEKRGIKEKIITNKILRTKLVILLAVQMIPYIVMYIFVQRNEVAKGEYTTIYRMKYIDHGLTFFYVVDIYFWIFVSHIIIFVVFMLVENVTPEHARSIAERTFIIRRYSSYTMTVYVNDYLVEFLLKIPLLDKYECLRTYNSCLSTEPLNAAMLRNAIFYLLAPIVLDAFKGFSIDSIAPFIISLVTLKPAIKDITKQHRDFSVASIFHHL